MMNDETDKPAPVKSYWKSRPGTTLIAVLVIAALVLGYEHRIHLFAGYGPLVILLLVCGGMHFFMHGRHGGHGGGGGGQA